MITNDLSGPGIYWMRADGAGEPQRLLEGAHAPSSFSPDGKRLAFSNPNLQDEYGIWTLPLDLTDPEHPKAGKPEPFLPSKFRIDSPAFSPDGRWIAYTSGETQISQIFVRPFGTTASESGGKWQISSDGGTNPQWSRNTRELIYLRQDGPRVVSYNVNGDSFSASQPRPWAQKFAARTGAYSIMPDGKRFVVTVFQDEARAARPTHVTFLLNFSDELRRSAREGK
jgi:serine/threonine-protein kinase